MNWTVNVPEPLATSLTLNPVMSTTSVMRARLKLWNVLMASCILEMDMSVNLHKMLTVAIELFVVKT